MIPSNWFYWFLVPFHQYHPPLPHSIRLCSHLHCQCPGLVFKTFACPDWSVTALKAQHFCYCYCCILFVGVSPVDASCDGPVFLEPSPQASFLPACRSVSRQSAHGSFASKFDKRVCSRFPPCDAKISCHLWRFGCTFGVGPLSGDYLLPSCCLSLIRSSWLDLKK